MRSRATLLGHAAVGAGTGAVVLGIGGRAGMVLVSLLTPLNVGLTLRGTTAVVITGALYGAVGGAIGWLLRQRLPAAPRSRGVVLGTLLFALAALVSIPNNQASAALLHPVLTAAVFWPILVAWGWWQARLTAPGGR